MAKTDFLKSWVVDVEAAGVSFKDPNPAFCILDDGEGKVLVRYCGFPRRFPSIQNGFYDEGEDVVVAVAEGLELMRFERSGENAEEIVTSLPKPGKHFRSTVMASGLQRPTARKKHGPRQNTRPSYQGSWIVRERGPFLGLDPPAFRVYTDPYDPVNENRVLIHYSRFDSSYPTIQNLYFDSGSKSIVGMMPSYRRLKLCRDGQWIRASVHEGVDGVFVDEEVQWSAILGEGDS